MRSLRFLAPATLVGVSAVVVLPTALQAFTLLGWQLGLGARDLRVFNNFSDATANDNQTPDPNFPGYFGADMAIWKAAVEWGSRLHGDGDGDPHQPGDLGSGGANFDFSWQGNAASAPGGSQLNNVIHEINGCNGGVVAITLSATNGSGWQVGFYSCWTWHDGPDVSWPVGPGDYDLQGISAHQLGYALGLGNSSVPGSTMYTVLVAGDGGKSLRSIEADDIAGVQANYGAAAATKPIISNITFGGANLLVEGAQFAAVGNEVWFTQAGAGGDGTPVKATGVASTGGGTQILIPLPAAAGSGDVLVKTPDSGGASLSNAWPLDTADPNGCVQLPPTNYCVATPNSTGAGVVMATSGSQSLVADDLVFSGVGMPSGQFGIFVSARLPGGTPIGNGVLCVGMPFYRWNVIQANPAGAWTWDPDLNNPPDPGAVIAAGETWYFQLWYRDPAGGGSGFNFSDGMRVGFCD